MECCTMETTMLCLPDVYVVLMVVLGVPAASLLGRTLRRFRGTDAGDQAPPAVSDKLAA